MHTSKIKEFFPTLVPMPMHTGVHWAPQSGTLCRSAAAESAMFLLSSTRTLLLATHALSLNGFPISSMVAEVVFYVSIILGSRAVRSLLIQVNAKGIVPMSQEILPLGNIATVPFCLLHGHETQTYRWENTGDNTPISAWPAIRGIFSSRGRCQRKFCR